MCLAANLRAQLNTQRHTVEVWRNLVARLVWNQGDAGSNPATSKPGTWLNG